MTTVDATECLTHWTWHLSDEVCPVCTWGHYGLFSRYTAYLAMPDDPPGHYAEEIDVATRSSSLTVARRIAEAAVAEAYDPILQVRRLRQTG